jgi:hypothetical protein
MFVFICLASSSIISRTRKTQPKQPLLLDGTINTVNADRPAIICSYSTVSSYAASRQLNTIITYYYAYYYDMMQKLFDVVLLATHPGLATLCCSCRV